MLKVEVIVPEDRVETIAELIRSLAQTGHAGDGKIVEFWLLRRPGARGHQPDP
jgi:nitrogen regulatory protein PII